MAVFLTILAGLSVYYALNQLYLPTRIIVPKKAIEPKRLIKEEDVKIAMISKRDKHPMAVVDLTQVVGKYSTIKLYADEQILTERLTGDPGAITGAFSYLATNETYITFKANEAKWPKGIKNGDTVTAIAIMDYGPEKVAEKLKVIGTEEPITILDPLKQTTGQGSSVTLTVAVDRSIAAILLDQRAKSKEFYFLPEHPNLEIQQNGGETIEQQPEQVSDKKGTGKRNK